MRLTCAFIFVIATSLSVAEPNFQELVTMGEKIHDKYCEICHTDGGSNPDDDAGILAGRSIGFLRKAINDRYNGLVPVSKKEKKRLTKLRKREGREVLEALISFYASNTSLKGENDGENKITPSPRPPFGDLFTGLYGGFWEGTMQCGTSRYNMHIELDLRYLSHWDNAVIDIYEQSNPEKVSRVRFDLTRRSYGFDLTQETWMTVPIGECSFTSLEARVDDNNEIVLQSHMPDCKPSEIHRTNRKLPEWRSSDFLSGQWSGTAGGGDDVKKRRRPPIARMNLHAVGEKHFAGEVTFKYTTVDIDVPYDDRYHKFRFNSSEGSMVWHGTIRSSGHSRMMYLKTSLGSTYGSMYLVKVDPLPQLGGDYSKHIDDFNTMCLHISDWIDMKNRGRSALELKKQYPVLLQNYRPIRSQINFLLEEDWFEDFFGKKPIELNEDEWFHILWITMDCAKSSSSWARLGRQNWLFNFGAGTTERHFSPEPECRLRTTVTPKDMMIWARGIVESKKVIDDVIGKAKTVSDGPNGVEEFKKNVIENGTHLSYALPKDIESFMIGVQQRLSTLQAAAICAKEYGLEVCRLPSASYAEKIITPNDMPDPPLSVDEKKRMQERIILHFKDR